LYLVIWPKMFWSVTDRWQVWLVGAKKFYLFKPDFS
jgi:hypothetical protein